MADDKKQNDELFANIDPSKLAPELLTVYKSMQADYTTKQQARAERERQQADEFAAKENALLDKIKTYGAMEQELNQWREWYKSLENKDDEIDDSVFDVDVDNNNYGLDNSHMNKVVPELNNKIKYLEEQLSSVKTAIKTTGDRTSRMLGFHAQLDELSDKYTNLDKQKLLDHAIQHGQNDLEKAYKDLYHDDIIEQEVQKRLDEERARIRTEGITGIGRQVVLRSAENSPKTFAEASEQILKSGNFGS